MIGEWSTTGFAAAKAFDPYVYGPQEVEDMMIFVMYCAALCMVIIAAAFTARTASDRKGWLARLGLATLFFVAGLGFSDISRRAFGADPLFYFIHACGIAGLAYLAALLIEWAVKIFSRH